MYVVNAIYLKTKMSTLMKILDVRLLRFAGDSIITPFRYFSHMHISFIHDRLWPHPFSFYYIPVILTDSSSCLHLWLCDSAKGCGLLLMTLLHIKHLCLPSVCISNLHYWGSNCITWGSAIKGV